MKDRLRYINKKLVRNLVLAVIILVALSLRFAVSLYNRQANDNHLEVINWILDKGQIPERKDCWECYQPPFYYLLNANVMRLLEITDHDERIVAAQLINFVFSIFLLGFVWAFIRNQQLSARIKLLAFSVIALNPGLAGINSQATNDTLEILTATMAIFYSDLFFKKWKPVYFICAAVSIILACITKGSGLILLLGIILVYVFQLVIHREKLKFMIVCGVSFIIVFMITVPFSGGYYNNYKKYNNAFVNNIDKKDPPPDFFNQTYIWRPGITSIVHGFFTFRIIELIKKPYNPSNGAYPLHRTSLWSQLYGHTFFLQFSQWPSSWATINPGVLLIGKTLLVLGLIPLILFLTGFYLAGRDLFHAITKRNKGILTGSPHWMHFLFFVSSAAFIVKYTYDYRDYSTMKAIFVFPVLLSIIALFMYGLSKIKSKLILRLTSIALVCSGFLSAADIYFLIRQLSNL